MVEHGMGTFHGGAWDGMDLHLLGMLISGHSVECYLIACETMSLLSGVVATPPHPTSPHPTPTHGSLGSRGAPPRPSHGNPLTGVINYWCQASTKNYQETSFLINQWLENDRGTIASPL